MEQASTVSSQYSVDLKLALLTVYNGRVEYYTPTPEDYEFVSDNRLRLHRRAKSARTTVQRQIELHYLPAIYVPVSLHVTNYKIVVPLFKTVGTQTEDIDRVVASVSVETQTDTDKDDSLSDLLDDNFEVIGKSRPHGQDGDGNESDTDSNYPNLPRRLDHIDPFAPEIQEVIDSEGENEEELDLLMANPAVQDLPRYLPREVTATQLVDLGFAPRQLLPAAEIVRQGTMMANCLRRDESRWLDVLTNRNCWNCKYPHHTTKVCPFIIERKQRGTYCFRCGAGSVNVDVCAFCNPGQYNLTKPV